MTFVGLNSEMLKHDSNILNALLSLGCCEHWTHMSADVGVTTFAMLCELKRVVGLLCSIPVLNLPPSCLPFHQQLVAAGT